MSRGRIGVNLLWMVPEVVGGSEDYTTRLLGALGEVSDHELVLFVRGDFGAHHPELADRWETVVAPTIANTRPVRVVFESTWLPRETRRVGVEVVHHPGGTLPWYAPTRTVLTVHDLQPLELPANFSPVKRQYLAGALPRSIARADKVTATSGYVARGLASRFGLEPDDVAVVPAGPGDVGPQPSEAELVAVRGRYGISDNYVIYPAITYPHKNHRVLLRSARLLDNTQIVLTGGAGQAEGDVKDYIANNRLGGVVRKLGRVPGEALDGLLWGARALVFPSLYEGFGLPVIEAMARGIPTVVADSTCLPELVGEAGVVVAPNDVSAWAEAINRVTTGPKLTADLAASGRARAAQFTSAEGARKLAAAYDEVLGR